MAGVKGSRRAAEEEYRTPEVRGGRAQGKLCDIMVLSVRGRFCKLILSSTTHTLTHTHTTSLTECQAYKEHSCNKTHKNTKIGHGQ